MKIKRVKLFFLTLISPFILNAGMLNGVSVIVDNEVITMYEIYKLSKEANLAYEDSIEKLIELKLREAEVKKRNIVVDKFEIEQELESIAQKSGFSLSQFEEVVGLRGISWSSYKKKVKQKIEQEKLDKRVSVEKLKNISEEKLKEYYEKNIDEFTIAKKFEVIKYSSSSKENLEKSVLNPMLSLPNVIKESEILDAKRINPKLLFILNDTSESSFSPILTTSNAYITFFIIKKMNIEYLSFSEVKDVIFSKLIKESQERVIKEYFEKLKAKAEIKVIRLPS